MGEGETWIKFSNKETYNVPTVVEQRDKKKAVKKTDTKEKPTSNTQLNTATVKREITRPSGIEPPDNVPAITRTTQKEPESVFDLTGDTIVEVPRTNPAPPRRRPYAGNKTSRLHKDPSHTPVPTKANPSPPAQTTMPLPVQAKETPGTTRPQPETQCKSYAQTMELVCQQKRHGMRCETAFAYSITPQPTSPSTRPPSGKSPTTCESNAYPPQGSCQEGSYRNLRQVIPTWPGKL